jgi:hypothetical protein
MAKIVSKYILIIIAWIFAIAVGEMLVRLAAPQYDPNGMIEYEINVDGVPLLRKKNVTLRQWKNTGDYDVEVYSNKFGLRNHKDFSGVTKNAIYVVGDSFAFGHGVEEGERFSDLLQEMGVGNGEVVNISIPTDIKGYQKLIDYAILHGANINKIILTLCVENDIQDYSRADVIDHEKKGFGLSSLKIYLMSHSAFYNLITAVVHQNPAFRSISQSLGFSNKIEDSVGGSNLSAAEISSSINQLKLLSSRYRSKFLIVVVPPRALWIGANTERAQKNYEYLIEQLKLYGFNVVDLRAEFESKGDPMQFHFKFDGHWNPAGHELAAKKIKKFIVESNF